MFTRLYGAIVAQARSPSFYRDYGVPDTVGGRLDMIILHLVLLLARLKGESAQAAALGQHVFDAFCRDIDDNFREMGVGDLAVPREMRSGLRGGSCWQRPRSRGCLDTKRVRPAV
jgi:cytochrome b pre-mRNA-processing protein 3